MSREILVDHKLNNGNLILSRDQKNGRRLLRFRLRLNTRHSADVIFDQLVLGFSASEKSWVWPLQFENTPESPPEGLRVGSVTRMTYRVPRFDKPEIPAKPITYSYEWLRWDPDARLLEYRGLDHPLQGGAVVRVAPFDGGGSQVQWDGAYEQGPHPSQEIVIASMINYLPLLYDTIEALIEAGPERLER